MKEILKRGAFSFAVSAFCGLMVNLIVDIIINAMGTEGFVSISPETRALFATPVIAAYINVLLYGVIGATFSMMTFLFDIDRLGFLVQSVLYFLLTSIVLVGVTVLLWQLHRYPQALIPTILGYGLSFFIILFNQYRELKKNIRDINQELQVGEQSA